MNRGLGFVGSELDDMNYVDVALTVNVVGEDQGSPDLKKFRVNRPCYLANTLDLEPDFVSHADFTEPTEGDLLINNAKFSSKKDFIDTFTVGALVELKLSGSDDHPIHIHINHYQINSFDAGENIDPNYYQVPLFCVTAFGRWF